MAGIGFEIRKRLRSNSYLGESSAYFHAAVLSCGPWITSILAIGALNVVLQQHLPPGERILYSTTITHAYAIALILTGPIQFVLTRHAADLLSLKRDREIFPALVASLTLTAALAIGVGSIVFGFLSGATALYRFGAISLLALVAMIFVCSNYLGALRAYRKVVACFALGFVISCTVGWLGATRWGVDGAIAGFSMGQLILLVTLAALLHKEVGGSRELASWDFLGYFRRFPALVLCGFFYNFGIWIDKIIFWRSSENSIHVGGVLYAAPAYDLPIYLSFLSMIPGFAVFFLTVETRFAEAFRRFLRAVNHGTLTEIYSRKDDMIESLRRSFGQLVVVQAFTTLTLLTFARTIGDLMGIGAVQFGIFRITLIGAFLLILFLSALTILFYLDDQRGALACAAVFGLGNALFSFASILRNESYYGIGFVCAAGMALLMAGILVNRRITRFEYHVFFPRQHTVVPAEDIDSAWTNR